MTGSHYYVCNAPKLRLAPIPHPTLTNFGCVVPTSTWWHMVVGTHGAVFVSSGKCTLRQLESSVAKNL